MNLYVGSLIVSGEADNLEAFLASLWDALAGDPEARKQIHLASPTVVNCGTVNPSKTEPS